MTGREVVEQFKAAGVVLRLEGKQRIMARPLSKVTPELRALIAEHRELVIAALWLREFLARVPRPCTQCAKLSGAFCAIYQRALAEPFRECRCVHFQAVVPW